MPHLTMLMGAPGSGKSTWASRSGARVVSTDGFREGNGNYGHTIASAYKQIHQHLAAGDNVVFDTPASSPAVRKAAIGIARRHRATVSATVIDTPAARCIEAQEGRRHPVPAEDVLRIHRSVRRQIHGLEDEGFDTVNIVTRKR